MTVPARAPVRVLHVLACDELAGTERMVTSLILRSDARAVSHELATLQPPGPVVAGVRAGARRAVSLGGSGGGLGAAWRLGRLLRTRDYEVVTAYGLRASVVARILVRVLRPAAVFVCGVRALHVTEVERLDSPKALIASAVERRLSPLVDMYDANSRAALDLLADLGVDAGRLTYIPNGLDLAEWTARPGEPEEPVPLVFCAARFVARKRQADLLEALALLARSGRSFRAVLAGGGPTLPRMRALSSSLGLDPYVELPGPVGSAEVRQLLERAALACLPSTSEGMPGALMEAMATGVAVVATDVPGTDELVGGGEAGILVPAYDPPRLAGAIGRLLDDPDLRRRVAAAGRRRMEERFSLDVMLAEKEQLFRRVVRRSAR